MEAVQRSAERQEGMPELRTHLFTIGIAGQSRTAILLCSGGMGPRCIDVLRGALAAAIDTEVPVVEVDLRKVRHLDRSVVRALFEAHHELAGKERELRLLVGPRTSVLLRQLGADAVLKVRSSGEADLSERPRREGREEGPGRGKPPEEEEP